MTCRPQHLSHDILYQHAFIHLQFVKHQLLIEFARHNATLIKGMANQQPRVTHITFQGGTLLVQLQANTRLRGIITAIDNLCI